jgi:hypothetical protein
VNLVHCSGIIDIATINKRIRREFLSEGLLRHARLYPNRQRSQVFVR